MRPSPFKLPKCTISLFPLSSFSFHCFLCQPHYGSCFKVIMCLFLHQFFVGNSHRFVLNCLVNLKPRGVGTALHSTKTSIFSSSEWNRIFQNFQNKGQPREVYLNLRKRFPWSFLSNGISRIFGWMVRISKIQQFPKFLETFPGNFCTICLCFQMFERFGWMESAPCFDTTLPKLLCKSCSSYVQFS